MLNYDDKSYKIVQLWLLNKSDLVNSYAIDNFHKTSLIILQHILDNIDKKAPSSVTFDDINPVLIKKLDEVFIQTTMEALVFRNLLTFFVFIPFLFLAFGIFSFLSTTTLSLLIALISHHLFNTKIKLILASLVTETKEFKGQKFIHTSET